MKKKLISCLAAGLLAFGCVPGASAQAVQPPVLQGTAACLMDADSGQVLYESNMDAQLPPASITKIMTVLLGAENGSWSDIVTMSHDAVYSVPRSASHIALQEGEQLTLEQALMATMLPSANDAANGVAEFVSGSMEAFAEKMNLRAAECGAKNTHFVNANGLDADGHVTTAYDMAAITRVAMQNPDFLRVFSTAEYTIPATNMQGEARNIGAGHKMMFDFTKYYDSGIIGGKSGYTEAAGHTLVTAVKRDGRTLIAVVLGEPANKAMYEDTVALFNYGFSAFTTLTVTTDQLSGGSALAQDTGGFTVLVTEGVTAKDLSFDYQTESTGITNCTVAVTVSLAQESGLQYARLGSTCLIYRADTAAAMLTDTQPESAAPAKNAGLPGPVRAVLLVMKLAVVAASASVFVCVFVMFYIRLRYEISGKRRARR